MTTCSYAQQENLQVRMQTNFGIVVIELFPQKAPKTVQNFLRYVDEGFYDDTLFHRVVKNFIIQGGGYTKNYEKKPTHEPIINESHNGLKNLRGRVAMARTFDDPNSATAQFFINITDNPSLDYQYSLDEAGYTVFGQVIKGIEVIDKMKMVETATINNIGKDVPKEMIVIAKVTVQGKTDISSFVPIEESETSPIVPEPTQRSLSPERPLTNSQADQISRPPDDPSKPDKPIPLP